MSLPRAGARALVAFPFACLLAGTALIATSLIGWSLDVDATPVDRVRDDLGLLITSAIAGGAAGALVAWAFTTRAALLAAGALVGMTPAFIQASAYFTGAY
ncbi:hypothetical protein [Nocardioides sp.]|uniref:hypothetical protein n=1 Tax=Nocardioides sp. TaxID=35761 RepID=UPI002D7FE7EB|nr:hypothetical protein [Nocardioides sp.]HET8961389.1 hypothetical protein [Nocardioides sp.]